MLYQSRPVLAYGDLKEDNLFWDEESQWVTILDPGSIITKEDVASKRAPHLADHILPPERLDGAKFNPYLLDRIDSWHLGLLGLAILFGKAWELRKREDRYSQESLASAREALSGAGLEVVVDCLEEDPRQRVSVEELWGRLSSQLSSLDC